MPKRKGPPVHFVEVFAYKTIHAYSNLFAKVFLWLEANNPEQDWRACVIFANRNLEPEERTPYRELLDSGRVKRVYLDELPQPTADQFGLGILEIIAAPADETIRVAKVWVDRLRTTKRPVANLRALVELVEVVVLSRCPHLSRKELERMLDLTDIRQSRVFQEALEEGLKKGLKQGREEGREEGMETALEKVALRSLAKGFSVSEVAELTGLPVSHVKKLKKKGDSSN